MKLFVAICISGFFILGIFLINPFSPDIVHKGKINGVSLVNPFEPIDSTHLSEINRINGQWVAVIPFAFCRQGQPEVHFNHERQWWGERLDGSAEIIRLAHMNGFKVMLKPHVWMRGDWIGEFFLEEEEDWKEWEQGYEEYIMAYAKQAQGMNVEMLCIATELKQVVIRRPQFWFELIKKIRTVYQGELTYAANWDNYQNVGFWKELDYIGVDAYFPLVHKDTPTLAEVLNAWEPLVHELRSYAREQGKPILFAEYGYMSANGAAGNHWEIEREVPVNFEVQQVAYEALYQSIWNEKWFAGGFLWKWHFNDHEGNQNSRFTPQGKPVEATIAKWYGQTNARN
ncbi:MAG: hypothetical protein RIC35_19325 [Marinoscillum sp.]